MINNDMNKDQTLALVFIHGAGLGSWIWRDVSPLMHSLVLAIDFPKRDKSFEERKSLTLNDYCSKAVKKIEYLKVQKVILVAHSLGGVIALKVAEALGDRVVGFVGISAVIPPNGGSYLSSLPPLMSFFMKTTLSIFGTKPPESVIVKGLCNDLSLEQSHEVVKRFVPESLRVYTDRSNVLVPKVKTLYIKLAKDQSFSVNLQDKMIANLNAPEIITMDTGHLPMLKNPKNLAEILNEFMEKIK